MVGRRAAATIRPGSAPINRSGINRTGHQAGPGLVRPPRPPPVVIVTTDGPARPTGLRTPTADETGRQPSGNLAAVTGQNPVEAQGIPGIGPNQAHGSDTPSDRMCQQLTR